MNYSVHWWLRDASCFYTDEDDPQYDYSILGTFKSIAWIYIHISVWESRIDNSDDNKIGILALFYLYNKIYR